MLLYCYLQMIMLLGYCAILDLKHIEKTLQKGIDVNKTLLQEILIS